MEVIYASIIGASSIMVGLVFAFFKGRASGARDSEAEQNTRKLEEIEAQQVIVNEIKAKIKESDSEVNSEDRDSLIAGLVSDSVRRSH